jgi:hypothetical protein
MELEQRPPNRPNFLLIVGLFCAAIVVIFILAYFFVAKEGKHLFHRSPPTVSQRMPTPFASSDPSRA